MLKIDDQDKDAKSGVLKEIMSLMNKHTGGKLQGLKKPAAVTAEPGDEVKDGELSEGLDSSPEHEALETPAEESLEHATGIEVQDEPSSEEKAQIKALYEKWCK